MPMNALATSCVLLYSCMNGVHVALQVGENAVACLSGMAAASLAQLGQIVRLLRNSSCRALACFLCDVLGLQHLVLVSLRPISFASKLSLPKVTDIHPKNQR